MRQLTEGFERRTANLFTILRETYRQYVAFHSDHEESESGTLALWTMHTWVFDVTEVTPYILVTAPTSEAGKSRIFDVARCVTREPMVVVEPSASSLFRAISIRKPTLFIDEMDMLAQSQSLKAILNSGISAGSPITRSKKVGDEWIVEELEVFCPKAFSGINYQRPPITGATLSRCIQIPMRRRLQNDAIKKFHAGNVKRETADLREQLGEWANEARELLKHATPDMPDDLTDRQEDSWSSLFAIADLAGILPDAWDWAHDLTRSIPAPPDEAVQMLSDVKAFLDKYIGDRITTAKLAEGINSLPERESDSVLNARQLGRRLAGFGVRADKNPFREGGKAPLTRGFTVRKGGAYLAPWVDAFKRYDL